MIRKFTEFILYSHIFIALGAFALNYSYQILLKSPDAIDLRLSLFCFGACWFSYLFHRFNIYEKRDASKDNEVMIWTKKNILVLRSIFPILGLALLYQFFQFNFYSQLMLALVGFISFAYSSSFFGFSLRQIPYLKIFLIGINWAACTSLLMLTEDYEAASFGAYAFAFLYSFLLIFALTIPFDIRDLAYDEKDDLKTIPGALGIKKSQWLSVLMLAAWSIPLIYIFYNFGDIPLLVGTIVFILAVSFFLLLRSTPQRGVIFYLGWVDGCIILWGLFIFALTELRTWG